MPYDTLVFCVGSVSNDFGTPGVAEHAISLDTAPDAERFHRRLLAACVRADERAARGESAAVDIVIIGAGATGVELAAEIRHCTRAHASYGLDNLDPERDIRLTLIEAAPAHAAAALRVDRRRGHRSRSRSSTSPCAPASASPRSTTTACTRRAARCSTPTSSSGRRASRHRPGSATLDGLEVNRAHQLVVDTTLATTRDPDIFALGDCAACPWPEAGREGAILPPRAQVARQQASLLVKSIGARLAGRPLPRFRFHDFGSLVSLGELSAVGSLMGRLIGGSLLVQGLIARWMYVSLYKLHQVSIHGYLRVALDTLSRIVRHRLEPRVKLH